MPALLVIGIIILFFFGWAGIGAVVFWLWHNTFTIIDIIIYSVLGFVGIFLLILAGIFIFFTIKEFVEWIIKKRKGKKPKWQKSN